MRFYLLASILILCLGCAGTRKDTAAPVELKGNWVPVREEAGGNALPEKAFQNQKLVLGDSSYTVTAESVDKGVVKYTGNKMDIYGKEGVNTGKHYTAIYKLENGELSICYNLSGDTYPESFETKGKAMCFTAVFKKDGAK